MKFGISWGYNDKGEHQLAFMGKWTPSVIAQDIWVRMKCFEGDPPQDSFPLGAQGTTILTDIEWGDLRNSPSLQQLKDKCESESNKLSIRVSYYYYTRNYGPLVPYQFTLGNVVGSIGVYNDGETLNIGGDRLMTSEGLDPPQLTFSQNDSCYGLNISKKAPWTSNAPFKLRDTGSNKEVVVDLSNALPTKTDGTQQDIGELYLGYNDTDGNCLQLIEPNTPIPYMENNWLESGALVVYSLTNDQYQYLLFNSLMVIQKVQGNQNGSLCENFPSTNTESGIIVLKEREYFIRPLSYYVDRLEYNGNTSSQTLYVTYYGAPAQNVSIKIKQANHNTTLPIGGVTPDQNTKTTDIQGKVTFVFSVNQTIPYPREYTNVSCPNQNDTLKTLPIDGQVYFFKYCILTTTSDCEPLHVSELTFIAFSTSCYTPPYTWTDHVKPIFTQYHDLSAVMKSILDLSNYTDVTLPWNIELIRHSMELDFEHANHMPTTRDLSPTKRSMILTWLNDPKYSNEDDTLPGEPIRSVCQHPSVTEGMSTFASYSTPPRCHMNISFDSHPRDADTYFFSIFYDTYGCLLNNNSRPLYGLLSRKRSGSKPLCTVEELKNQLQLAMQLEFYTIPTYLTTLYSIVDGCNIEIYNAIREVVMQEMLHFAQAANLLISIGGTPVIDSPDFAPRYPARGLPGGVLPGLHVDLKKLSLEHVYNVFMGIEVPENISVGGDPEYANNTIGHFYEEIRECFNSLPNDTIDPSSVSKQVSWPWNGIDHVGNLIKVHNHETAISAINEIIHQEEGVSPLNPDSFHDEYAHFYRFEEIVCQNRLVKVNDSHYVYSGDPIPFDPRGVWPMRANPDSFICPNTNCFHEAQVFHHQYRGLLNKLNDTFSCNTPNCDPQKLLWESIEIMEALQIHAKKLMWIKFNPNNSSDIRTCGPVWDYNWNDVCSSNY